MHTETAKMIYPQQAVANMIAGKMTKSKGQKYDVYKVTTGWQVVPVNVCKPHVPPAKPAPVLKLKKASEKATPANAVKIALPFKMQSPSYVTALFEGKPIHFGKSTLIDWSISDDGMTVTMVIPEAIAKKRGLMHLVEGGTVA